MKRFKIITVVCVTAVMLFAAGCGKAKDTSKDAKPAAAKAAKNTVEASGTVKASDIKNIVIDMPMGGQAKVSKVLVKDGQKVNKGDKLVELDLSDYNALITQKSKAIDADWSLRKDMVTSNQKNAQSLKIAAQQAELDALKAKTNKSYISGSNIVCDIDNAVVSDIGYFQGDIVGAQQKVLSLLDLKNLYVIANIDEEFIKDVEEGRSVTIIPKSDRSSKFNGKVTKVLSQAIKQNGETSIPVEIAIENNNGKLLPNYSVDIEISKN